MATLTPVSPQHLDSLATLHAAAFDAEAWTKDQIEGSLSLPTTVGWLTEVEATAAGFILAQSLNGEAEILTLAVHPSFRRQGLAETLLRHLMRSLSSQTRLFLEVAEDNLPAIRLYEKAGFKINGIRPHYYKRGENLVNALNYINIIS